MVAALFIHFQCVDSLNDDNKKGDKEIGIDYQKKLVHNVAQLCHCLAQGKVGSGFDVSSAVWGSHVYKRFSPEILNNIIMEDDEVGNFFNFLFN